MNNHVAIIGTGFGGIAAAHLARHDLRLPASDVPV
jgi:cation diffusion facilitator CzcD-associated flavoprotein CzcO